jgi:hypothetical protein
MGKKVFISHASEDKQIVSLFVDQILCAGSGVNIEDVIYTSRDDSGVVNGNDIPSCIKDGIKQAAIFFMMVSEKYRNSEVCLNEMGAAWMLDDLPKKILLMPGSSFNKIGWLMSLKKGTELSDSSGLDALHDQIIDILSTRIQTATWNRCKEVFLNKLNELTNMTSNDSIDSSEDEIDIIDMRESFEKHNKEIVDIMSVLTKALNDYADKMTQLTTRINQIVATPKSFTSEQVRIVFKNAARDTDNLSLVYETNTPLLRESFDYMMKSAIMLQGADIADDVKNSNRIANKGLIDAMIYVRDQLMKFKGGLTGIVDIDKTFKKSKNRLIEANDQLLEVISFCISRATEYQMT